MGNFTIPIKEYVCKEFDSVRGTERNFLTLEELYRLESLDEWPLNFCDLAIVFMSDFDHNGRISRRDLYKFVEWSVLVSSREPAPPLQGVEFKETVQMHCLILMHSYIIEEGFSSFKKWVDLILSDRKGGWVYLDSTKNKFFSDPKPLFRMHKLFQVEQRMGTSVEEFVSLFKINQGEIEMMEQYLIEQDETVLEMEKRQFRNRLRMMRRKEKKIMEEKRKLMRDYYEEMNKERESREREEFERMKLREKRRLEKIKKQRMMERNLMIQKNLAKKKSKRIKVKSFPWEKRKKRKPKKGNKTSPTPKKEVEKKNTVSMLKKIHMNRIESDSQSDLSDISSDSGYDSTDPLHYIDARTSKNIEGNQNRIRQIMYNNKHSLKNKMGDVHHHSMTLDPSSLNVRKEKFFNSLKMSSPFDQKKMEKKPNQKELKAFVNNNFNDRSFGSRTEISMKNRAKAKENIENSKNINGGKKTPHGINLVEKKKKKMILRRIGEISPKPPLKTSKENKFRNFRFSRLRISLHDEEEKIKKDKESSKMDLPKKRSDRTSITIGDVEIPKLETLGELQKKSYRRVRIKSYSSRVSSGEIEDDTSQQTKGIEMYDPNETYYSGIKVHLFLKRFVKGFSKMMNKLFEVDRKRLNKDWDERNRRKSYSPKAIRSLDIFKS